MLKFGPPLDDNGELNGEVDVGLNGSSPSDGDLGRDGLE